MSFKSKSSGKLQWISRWWFLQLNTCFWMMCFGTLHKIGEGTLGPSWGKFQMMGWQVKRPARQLDLTLIMIIYVPGPWWVSRSHVLFWQEIWEIFFKVKIQHLQNCEEFVPLSYNSISPRRRLCFPPKNVKYERSASTLGCSHGILVVKTEDCIMEGATHRCTSCIPELSR